MSFYLEAEAVGHVLQSPAGPKRISPTASQPLRKKIRKSSTGWWRPREPAWHRRERKQRQHDRVTHQLVAATLRLASHHGSQPPRIVQQMFRRNYFNATVSWSCDLCGSQNWMWRSHCHFCHDVVDSYIDELNGTAEDDIENDGSEDDDTNGTSLSWTCVECGVFNWQWRKDCYCCNGVEAASRNNPEEAFHLDKLSCNAEEDPTLGKLHFQTLGVTLKGRCPDTFHGPDRQSACDDFHNQMWYQHDTENPPLRSNSMDTLERPEEQPNMSCIDVMPAASLHPEEETHDRGPVRSLGGLEESPKPSPVDFFENTAALTRHKHTGSRQLLDSLGHTPGASSDGDHHRRRQVRQQIEHYFSVENLCNDWYLRTLCDSEGWASLHDIITFPRIRSMGIAAPDAAAALMHSEMVEVSDDRKYIRSKKSCAAHYLENYGNDYAGTSNHHVDDRRDLGGNWGGAPWANDRWSENVGADSVGP